MMNKRIHVLTDPNHVAAAHHRTSTFEFPSILKSVLISLGGSREGADLLWDTREEGGVLKKGVIPKSHEFQARQTSGTDLKVLTKHIGEFLAIRTSPEALKSAGIYLHGLKCIDRGYEELDHGKRF